MKGPTDALLDLLPHWKGIKKPVEQVEFRNYTLQVTDVTSLNN